MEAFLLMTKNVLLFVALAVPAWILVKTKRIAPEQSATLSNILLYAGLPFFVFSSTLGVSFTGETAKQIVSAMAIAVGISFLTLFLSAPIVRREKDPQKNGMLRFCMIFSNNGFLGIPLGVAVFGADSLVVTYLIATNIVTNTFMYTVGVYLVTGDRHAVSVIKTIFNPVLIAFALGLSCNLLGVAEKLPVVETYAGYFANVVTPISMSVIGMKLGGVRFSDIFKGARTYFVCFFKLVALPVLTTGICFVLKAAFSLSAEMTLAMFMTFSMPTATLSTTLADRYDGDTEGAVSYTLATTMLSVATIPCFYWLLCMLL